MYKRKGFILVFTLYTGAILGTISVPLGYPFFTPEALRMTCPKTQSEQYEALKHDARAIAAL